MRRETEACNRCYGTNSVLAMKINIVLEINVNSFLLAGRREGAGHLRTLSGFYHFHFKIS